MKSSSIRQNHKYRFTTPVSGNAAARRVALEASTIARGSIKIPAVGGTVKVLLGNSSVDCTASSFDVYAPWGSNDSYALPLSATDTHMSILGSNLDDSDFEVVLIEEE